MRGTGYSLSSYGEMIADGVRIAAYRDALAKTVRPGAVVLDLGAGTGIMSLLACQLGAGRVYAVEPSDALAVGVELAHANGFADRIEFIQRASLDLTLPARADVIVSDLRGVLPLHGQHIPSLVDARRRLLAPGGALIPQHDTVRAQLVSDESLHDRSLKVWKEGVGGLDLRAGLRWASHVMRKEHFSGSRLVGSPQEVFAVDYRTVEDPNASGTCAWTMADAVVLHGLAAWFDTVLAPGVGFSNAPDRARAIYGQMYIPFEEPLRVAPGDQVRVNLGASLAGDDYVWQWNTEARDRGGAVRRRMRQSSFHATPLNPARLGRRAADYVPQANARTHAAARALALFEQRLSVDEIAARLAGEFAGQLDARAVRALVGDLCDWLGDP